MLDSYLSEFGFASAARVLEVGCGTGAVTRVLARRPEVAEAVGVDPSPVFVAKASELAARLGNITDTRSLTAVRSAAMPAVRRLEAGLPRKQDGTRMPQSQPEGHRVGQCSERMAAWNRQPVLFEQHRVSPSAFAGSAPHC
jgi:SAM-dependent methyltransferase